MADINEVITLLEHYYKKVRDYPSSDPGDIALFTRVDKKRGKSFLMLMK